MDESDKLLLMTLNQLGWYVLYILYHIYIKTINVIFIVFLHIKQ